MSRLIRHEVDERILDRAAGLFAQHGFTHTSLKTVADAVGLSKAGLLHHFPTKDALYEAAMEMGREQSRVVVTQAMRVPEGPARERRAIELLTDVALDRPGLVALAFSSISALGGDGAEDSTQAVDPLLFEVFAMDPENGDTGRQARVIACLSGLAVLSLIANHRGDKTGWRPHIIATCLDALGHEFDQVEA